MFTVQPHYWNIEFCRNAETMWGKMREGRWDWLGVHKDGKFVLGSPPRGGGLSGSVASVGTREGAEIGQHGVRIYRDPQAQPSEQWFPTPEDARQRFNALADEYRAHEGPFLVKLVLVLDGAIADENYVVVAPPTYGEWRQTPGAP